jgi:predicted regulator of Ras-like GTPase activity (Roadblock/LC7/MglB family)
MKVKEPKTDAEIIQQKLQSIKDQRGIIGYILRNKRTASVDLNDPTKVIDYAMLSSTALEVGDNMTKSLQMGEVDTIVVESETTKILSLKTNNYNLSLFMEKEVDHDKLSKKLI